MNKLCTVLAPALYVDCWPDSTSVFLIWFILASPFMTLQFFVGFKHGSERLLDPTIYTYAETMPILFSTSYSISAQPLTLPSGTPSTRKPESA